MFFNLGLSHETRLLLCALATVIGLVVLIARYKLNSFVALVLAALFMGLCSGMNLTDIGRSLQEGVGAVLGSIAVVVGLGTTLVPKRSGTLFLRVNDSPAELADNAGSLEVRVERMTKD